MPVSDQQNVEGEAQVSVFALVGGWPYFVDLIDDFYDRVDTDEILRPLYPTDLTDSRQHMVGFLGQYWGGPDDYSRQRGHPRLRMRHAPFVIGTAERDAWLGHMLAAVEASTASPEIKQQMVDYFEMASTHMINSPG